MKLVRGSAVSDFLRCRLRWKWRWIDGLKPKRPDNKLFFGNLFHKFIEVYYSNNRNQTLAMYEMEKMFREADTSGMSQVELDELWDLAVNVTQNYVKQWDAHDQDIQVIATELRFAIPLDDEIVYEGTIDLVFLDQNGQLKFRDYKTASSIDRYQGMAEMDRQISRYWWALQQLARGNGYVWYGDAWCDVKNHPITLSIIGAEPSGFEYDIVLKDFPTPPEPLKKDGLSKAKAQKTTYEMYVQALKDNGLLIETPFGYQEPEEYREIVQHLKAQETEQGNRFFRRIPVIRNEAEVQAAIQEFYATTKDMDWVRDTVENGSDWNPIYRNITHECNSMCGFKSLCLASMDGSNVDMLRNLGYDVEKIDSEVSFNG